MNEDSKFYTTLQYQEYADEEDNSRVKTENSNVFAKAIKNGLSRDMTKKGPQYYRYYIRCLPNKAIFDPFPKYSVSDNRQSFIDRICRPETSYREVSPSIFEKYLNYLKTENSQWLKNAQKELNSNVR